jgi:hypothetical protein
VSRRVAILQSNYVPWKGYFDLIGSVDEFVLYDDVQYTKNDWRNRNRIKTAQGVQWLTIPVRIGGRFGQRVRDAEIAETGWGRKHWRTLSQSYARAPHFERAREAFEDLYMNTSETSLSLVNRQLLERACTLLDIQTRISWSHEYSTSEGRIERLVDLCRQLGADEYLTGPAARSYLDVEAFEREGIRVIWMDYANYPEYPQLFPPFVHEVSILDLLFNAGPDATRYLKPVGRETAKETRDGRA